MIPLHNMRDVTNASLLRRAASGVHQPWRQASGRLAASIALFMAATLCGVRGASADGGELSLGLTVDQEAVWTRYSAPNVVQPDEDLARSFFVPRFGGSLSYGVANRLQLGVTGRASLPSHTTLDVGEFATRVKQRLTLQTHDVILTGHLQTTVYDGTTVFADVMLDAGVSMRHWQVEKTQNRDTRTPTAITPAQRNDSSLWRTSPYVRLSTSVRYRPYQHLAIAIAPYVASTLQKEVAVGGAVAFQFPFAAGPSW